MTTESIRLGLALSGGTARSIVHVGILKALEEEGIAVDLVAGTSGGSLVGALYAAGMPVGRMEEIAVRTRWRDLAGLILPRMGLLSSESISRFLTRHVGHLSFEDLRVPLAVVATDLLTGKKVVLDRGPVAEAVRASCSIPQIYAPVELNGQLLVDGGLVEYLPVLTARAMGADLVLAVNVWWRDPHPERPRNMIQVMMLAIGMVAGWNIEAAEDAADIVVHPDVSGTSPFSLDAGPALIAAGYAAMRKTMPSLKKEIERHRGMLQRFRQLLRGDAGSAP